MPLFHSSFSTSTASVFFKTKTIIRFLVSAFAYFSKHLISFSGLSLSSITSTICLMLVFAVRSSLPMVTLMGSVRNSRASCLIASGHAAEKRQVCRSGCVIPMISLISSSKPWSRMVVPVEHVLQSRQRKCKSLAAPSLGDSDDVAATADDRPTLGLDRGGLLKVFDHTHDLRVRAEVGKVLDRFVGLAQSACQVHLVLLLEGIHFLFWNRQCCFGRLVEDLFERSLLLHLLCFFLG